MPMKQSLTQTQSFDDYLIIKLDLIAGTVKDLRAQVASLSTALETAVSEIAILRSDVENRDKPEAS